MLKNGLFCEMVILVVFKVFLLVKNLEILIQIVPYITTDWLKDERPSNIINFRCLLPKADFRIFYFQLQTLLNRLVKLCSSFIQKNNFEQKCSVIFS